MNFLRTTSHQSRADAIEVARINALGQAEQPVRRTTITAGGKTVDITTDKVGRFTITKRTEREVVPSSRPAGLDEAVPAAPGQPDPTVFTTEPTRMEQGIPPEAVDMAMGFFVMCAVMVVGWPIARALGRRIERSAAAPAMQPQVSAQLHRIEQAVESMAIEVERISESQRFVARLQSRSEERV